MEKEFFNNLRKHCLDFGLNLNEVLFEKIFYIINNNIPILKYENPIEVKPVSLYFTDEIIAYLEEFVLKNNITKRDVYYTAMKLLEEEDLKNVEEYYKDISNKTTSSNKKLKNKKNTIENSPLNKNNYKGNNSSFKEENNKKIKSTNFNKNNNKSNLEESNKSNKSNFKENNTKDIKSNLNPSNNNAPDEVKSKNIEEDNSVLSMKSDSEGNISLETISTEQYNNQKATVENNANNPKSVNIGTIKNNINSINPETSPDEFLSSFDPVEHLHLKYADLIKKYERAFKNNKINSIIRNFDKDKETVFFEGKSKTVTLDSMSSSLKKEFYKNTKFFNNICGHKLDKHQRLATIVDDDNIQIIAGAGTGKTLTLISKVKYLVQLKGVDPRKILCLSFNNSSAKELSQKLKNELRMDIETKTFHSLGLKIIASYDKSIKSSSMDYAKFFIRRFKNSLSSDEMKSMIKLGYDVFNISKYSFEAYMSNKPNLSNEDRIREEYNFVLTQCPLPGLIEDFIESFKRKNYSFDKFYEFYTDPYYFTSDNEYTRCNIENRHIFLDIVCKFFIEYELYLLKNNMVDFSDMINKSIPLVELEGLKYSYDYILIDEYQDTSFLNYKLIRAIKEETNSKIVVVGDDWQSIYGFRDTHIELFTDFPKYFNNPTIVFTNETYRNSQELIDVASKFVLSNKKQIEKELVSNVPIDNPPIQISYIPNLAESKQDILSRIITDLTENYPGSDLYILARTRDNIKNYLAKSKFFTKNPKIIGKSNNFKIFYPKDSKVNDKDMLNINFKTIHASKGLEADNVIILLDDNFPSTRSSHSLLNYVSSESDFGLKKANEERRLFYVALSRTKNNVYIISDSLKKSSFMRELEEYSATDIFPNSFEIYYNFNDDLK